MTRSHHRFGVVNVDACAILWTIGNRYVLVELVSYIRRLAVILIRVCVILKPNRSRWSCVRFSGQISNLWICKLWYSATPPVFLFSFTSSHFLLLLVSFFYSNESGLSASAYWCSHFVLKHSNVEQLCGIKFMRYISRFFHFSRLQTNCNRTHIVYVVDHLNLTNNRVHFCLSTLPLLFCIQFNAIRNSYSFCYYVFN